MYSLADDIPKELQGKKTPTEPRIISWQHRHCIHQSSIKAMEISSLSDGEYLIVAGGDDNAISISRLRIGATAKSDTTKNSFATISLPQAHASAITTISILEKNTRLESMDSQVYQVFGFLIASSGNDQRLKLWSIQLDSTKPREDGISVSLLQDVYTAVADMASMGSFRSHIGKSDDKEHGKLKDGLVLCGVGVDLWSLRNK
ncbi:hypothetical protein RJZ56_006247 [Blastomyces dermatitidis]